jgi:hypothetical protein
VGGHEQALDLLVRVVGEREHDPVGPGAGDPRLHGDAPHDAVAARGRGDADLVAVGAVALDGRGQVDRGRVRGHAHGLNGPGRRQGREGREGGDQEGDGEGDDPQQDSLVRNSLNSARRRPVSGIGRQA